MSIKGKTAIVTGSTSGIGLGIAHALAKAGANIVTNGLGSAEDNAKAIDSVKALGVKVSFDPANMLRPAEIAEMVAKAERDFGSVDIVVNNAGITGKAGKTWELEREVMVNVLDVNVVGPFLLCKAVLPGMMARKYGRIVNIASVAGKEGNPTMGPYSASKAAIIALTKSMAKEVVGNGDITVNSISPAVIHTPILDGLPQSTVDYMVSRIPMGRTGKPEEVAALVHFLASAEASFTTAQCYDISGGRSTY